MRTINPTRRLTTVMTQNWNYFSSLQKAKCDSICLSKMYTIANNINSNENLYCISIYSTFHLLEISYW